MILASQSPRRRELLGLFCPEFEVMPAQGEESLPDGISPREAVMLLSKQKAEEISARKFPDGNITDTIIAADTIVATDGEILGKPKSQEHAAEMLRRLSGRVHSVFTGVTLITPKTSVTFEMCIRDRFCTCLRRELQALPSPASAHTDGFPDHRQAAWQRTLF